MNINVSPYSKSVVVDDNINFNDILICWFFKKTNILTEKILAKVQKIKK